MLTLISPAKTLDYSPTEVKAQDTPAFRKNANELVDILKTKSSKELMELMSISQKLGDENFQRYQDFSNRYSEYNSKAALLAFKGDVYLGLDAESLNQDELEFAQNHLRILSGLYGVLRPLDKMQPYRLEMGTALPNQNGKNLYEFWGDQITKNLNRELSKQDNRYIINLASKEYFSAVNTKKLKAKIIDINFREYRNGKLMFLSFNAKKARGFMARYIIQNRLDKPEHLKSFNIENYYFSEELSSEDQYSFVR